MLFIFKLKIGKSYIMKKGGKTVYVHNDIEHLQKPKSKYMIFINKYQSKGLLILPAPGGLSLHSQPNPATV